MNTVDFKAIPALESDISILEQEEANLNALLKSVRTRLKKFRKSLSDLQPTGIQDEESKNAIKVSE